MAGAGDPVDLARRLRGQGLDDDEIVEQLQRVGFNKAEAREALDQAAGSPARSRPGRRRRSGSSRGRGTARTSSSPRARSGGRGRGGLGRAETAFDSAAREAGRVTLTPPKRLTARDGSGFLLGMLAYVLTLNYIRHGPEGVRGWVAAKFINKPWTPPERRPARGGKSAAADRGAGGLANTRPRPPGTVAV